MINLSGDARSLRLYSLHVKVCDDQDLLKDEYDDQFSGLLFFIGGVNMGQAPHLKTPAVILPIPADQLFNLGEDGDDCLYRVLLTGKQGVVEQLCSFYDPWVNAPNERSPSPPSESSSLASLKTSNTAAATLTASARRAELSAGITNDLPFDEEGFHDVDAFWDASVEAVKAMHPDLPPGWPVGAAKPDDEVAVAEATKSANILALAAFVAAKKTKAAEDEAAAKLVQEKAATSAILTDAEVTKAANGAAALAKAAEDEAAAKLVQEKAAAAAAANISKAAEDDH
eukprot:scaffold16464_cov61-Attheya_sp.AAC.1